MRCVLWFALLAVCGCGAEGAFRFALSDAGAASMNAADAAVSASDASVSASDASVSTADASVSASDASVNAADASIGVDFTRDAGPSPLLFRLGVQLNGAADEVGRALMTEQRVGHVRLDLGYLVMSPATSAADAVARVKRANARAQVEALRATGAQITLNLVETPRYLSSCPEKTEIEPISGWPLFSTCPPRDLAEWTALVSAIVTEVGSGPLWEVWNEPDGIFWSGTPAQFFELYLATVRGVRQADPSALVGGPAVSGPWAGTEPGSATPGFIEQWLAYCASHPIADLGLARTPVDFVVWHEYGLLPGGSSNAIHDVRRWATAAGYPAATLSVDEWNVQTEGNPPGGLSDQFHTDSEFGAAWAVRQLLEMHRAGLDRHAYSALADWSNGPGEFHGGQGLTTTAGLRKPVWNAMRLLGSLHGQLGSVSVSGEAPLLDGVASVASDSAWVVLVNAVPDWRFALEQFIAVEHAADKALIAEIDSLPDATKRALLIDFTVTGAQLPVSTPAKALADVLAARSRQVLSAQGPVTASLSLRGVPAGFTRLRRFVVDAKTSNSYRAWQAAGGTASALSLSQAKAAQGLELVEDTTWSGAALTVTLERDAVVAIELSAP